ncbi:hypothetical protein QOT17_008668 [Balamuthia mandrillaris]
MAAVEVEKITTTLTWHLPDTESATVVSSVTQVASESRRKKKWVPRRDSLAYRQRKGKRGSRRFQRFMNALEIGATLETWEYDEEFMEQLTWHPEWKSVFELLFTSETNKRIWEPFRDITEEEQDELLNWLCGSADFAAAKERHASAKQEAMKAAEKLFLDIDRSTRDLLKENFGYNSSLVEHLEAFIMPLIYGFVDMESGEDEAKKSNTHFKSIKHSGEDLHLVFNDSRDRKVCHGVCKYYSLKSSSKNKLGKRITVISKPSPSSSSKRNNEKKKKDSSSTFPDAALLSEYLHYNLNQQKQQQAASTN